MEGHITVDCPAHDLGRRNGAVPAARMPVQASGQVAEAGCWTGATGTAWYHLTADQAFNQVPIRLRACRTAHARA